MMLLFALLASISAFTVKETCDFETYHAPQGWSRGGDAHPSQAHSLTFAFRMSDARQKALHDAVMSVSDPDSPKYLDFWTKDQVDAFSRVTPEAKVALEEFVGKNFGGIAIDWSDVGYASIVVTVEEAEKALHADFQLFTHPKLGGQVVTRTLAYSLPDHLHKHIAFVGGTVRFPSMRGVATLDKAATKPNAANGILPSTPSSLRRLYSATNAKPSPNTNTTNSFAQFIGQFYTLADLFEFQTIYVPDMLGWEPKKTIGPDSGLPGIESELDIQYLSGVSHGIPMIVYSTASSGTGSDEPFLTWVKAMLKQPDNELPNSVSISYGDVESGLSRDYAMHVCDEFAKVGLRGVSVIFAAGDSGASCNVAGNLFGPDYPASCPYVTTIGGTEPGPNARNPETVTSIGGSGFSNYFPTPDWQKTTVNKWLAAAGATAPLKFFNASGRAYPDTSAVASAAWVVAYLIPEPVAGTSLAAPTWNAILSLVLDHRMSNGKKPLGFLNPLLYKLGNDKFQGTRSKNIFNEITMGCNMGCGSNNGIGFCALKNGYWSPGAGWGTPNYEQMITIA